jgi:TonB family protein
MHFINAAMLSVGNSQAASVVVKATLAVALGIAGAWLARGSRAAVRHAVLAAAFGVLLLLPIVSTITPPFRIVVEEASVATSGPPTDAIEVAGVTRAAPRPGISLSALLLWGWIAGTILFLTPMAMGLWQVRFLRRSGAPWPRGQALAMGLAAEAGIRRRIEVLLANSLSGPMTCGIVRPLIVLSADAETWAEEDLTRAIVHELEHVRRGDRVTHCLARAICAAYWFHPLVWLAWRRLELEAERSCDDAVLARSEATAYADQLVELARRLTRTKSPLLAMANRADLAARVSAVLDTGQRRGRAGTAPWALSCLAGATFVLTMSPLTTVAAPQVSSQLSSQVSTSANPGGSMPRLVSRIDLVTEDVVVTGAGGKDIGGLTPADFELTEDGMPRNISVFEYQNAGPIFGRRTRFYVLGYYARGPSRDGEFRKIAITLKGNANATLQYRSGYYSGSPVDTAFAGVADRGGVKFDAGTRPPAVIFKKDPEYSEEARKARFQGAVVFSMVVDTSGWPSQVRVIRSLGLGLDEKAVDAVSQWRFRPGTKDGTPVAMPVQVAVDFRLP